MSRLIGNARNSGNERLDADCPECGSGEVFTSVFAGSEELETVSAWCETCGYGFMTKR